MRYLFALEWFWRDGVRLERISGFVTNSYGGESWDSPCEKSRVPVQNRLQAVSYFEREKRGRSPNEEKIRDYDGNFAAFHASLIAVIDSSSFLPLIGIILAFRFPRVALRKEGRPPAV